MLLTWKEVVFKTNPTYLLVDNRLLDFPISPVLQEWVTTNIWFPSANVPTVKKFCFVRPEEFISRLSVTQLNDDQASNMPNEVETAHFDTLESAQEWLLG